MFKSLYCIVDCSILLKFGTIFDHATPDELQTFKVKWSKVKVTASKYRQVIALY